MKTSTNGNIFPVTGHLCGEFTDPRRISHTKASDAEVWCFLWSISGRWVSQMKIYLSLQENSSEAFSFQQLSGWNGSLIQTTIPDSKDDCWNESLTHVEYTARQAYKTAAWPQNEYQHWQVSTRLIMVWYGENHAEFCCHIHGMI